MRTRLGHAIHRFLERRFPEKRLFLRSDTETRFIRLKPETQLLAWTGSTLIVGWTIVATAILLMDSIGAGNFRAQAQRDTMIYEDRLNALSEERDMRAAEAIAAQQRFSTALQQVSIMQTQLLNSEDQLTEVATGLEVVQATLRRTMMERDQARDQVNEVLAANEAGTALPDGGSDELAGTVDILADALRDTAQERDAIAANAEYAITRASELELEIRLRDDRNDEIFRRLEEAMLVSVEPLDAMFRAAGSTPTHSSIRCVVAIPAPAAR